MEGLDDSTVFKLLSRSEVDILKHLLETQIISIWDIRAQDYTKLFKSTHVTDKLVDQIKRISHMIENKVYYIANLIKSYSYTVVYSYIYWRI